MMSIDQYVYANKLLRVHPAEKLLFAIVTMIICLISTSIYIPMIVMVLTAGLIIFKAGIPAKYFGRMMLIPIAFLIIGELSIAFSISNQPGGYLYYFSVGNTLIGVNAQDLNKAVLLFGKSLGSVSCLYFLALTTPIVEITSVLRKLKVPPLFLELMSLIYRFVFVLLDSAAMIRTSQSSRLGYVNLNSSYRSTSQLLYALFIKSLQRSQAVATALEARCYQGEIRVLEKKFPSSMRNYISIITMDISLVMLNLYIGGGQLFG